MKNKKVLIFILLIIVAAGIGVGAYFMTSKGNDKKETKNEPSKTAKAEENIEEQEPNEEVTYLEFPDKSEEERQILERYSNNNDYKVIPISGSKFSGYLVAVYEPERMHVAVTSKMGYDGEYVDKMVSDNNALLGINAGGFADADFNGDGGTPAGLTIARNKMVVSEKYTNNRGGVVGFNAQDKLVLKNLDSNSVVSEGMRDCVSFAPYLIVDGQAQTMTGSGAFGPSGRTARSVIGQREDGIVLLLCVDGDRTKGEGATLPEMIEIMQKYGAVNASDLDGGTSCQLVVGDKMINDPTSLNGEHRSRPVATAFVLDADDSNNGDSSAVK
ncbi:MAG: phosphodiester glycosidase family protein [Clostridia bacterium]|nr:phosphodiester glycosidase family protein [Clostridia bacterium]